MGHIKMLSWIIIVVAGLTSAQTRTTTAPKIPTGSILIDGVLSEYFWQADEVGEKIKIDNTLTTDGTIDSDGDCHAFFKTLWDDNGIYVGTWYYDDIHNAMNSQYLDAANIAYDDDGLEYWFDYSFDDAWSATASNQALYYKQLVKGFGNMSPDVQYGGWWGGEDGRGLEWSTGVLSVPEQQAIGWYEVFASLDGINYTSEIQVTWAGSLMRQVGSMSEGGSIGFDMKVNDNDGAFTIQGAMHWTGLTHMTNPGLHWGKVNLGSPAGIRPTSVRPYSRKTIFGQYATDVLGRRTMAQGSPATTVLFALPAVQDKAGKQIHFR